MREKLIELLKSPHKAEQLRKIGANIGKYEDDCVESMVADYLLANGVIVPPCKVGDTVYEIERYDFESCKHCGKNGDVCPYLHAEVGFGYECLNTKYGEKPLECSKIEVIKIQDITYIFHRWFDFGKTVFLTRKDAENVLAKGETDEEL